MTKVIKTYWLTTPYGCMGVVLGEDEITKERDVYIGQVSGHHIEIDIECVIQCGEKLPLWMAKEFVEFLENKPKDT